MAKLGNLEVDYVEIGSIQPNSYNPNMQTKDEFELLCTSMRRDGFTQPILVQREGRTIVDGEHRWRAAQVVGYTTVPVVFVTMTPEQMRIATLRHNRARGQENAELAAEVMRDLVTYQDVDLNDLSAELNVDVESLALELKMALPLVSAEDLVPGLNTATDNMIPASISDMLRAKEVELIAQRQKEDGAMAKRDDNYYFVSLVFTQEEGKRIQEGLATFHTSQPQAFLQLCRQALAEQW
jgi:ParB/RepB/Spo0J family partition protein